MKQLLILLSLSLQVFGLDGEQFAEFSKQHSKIVRELKPLSSTQIEQFGQVSKVHRSLFIKLYREVSKTDDGLATLTDELQDKYDQLKLSSSKNEALTQEVNTLKNQIKIYLIDNINKVPAHKDLYTQWADAVIKARENFWLIEVKKYLPEKIAEYKAVLKGTRSSLLSIETNDF